MAAMKCLFVYPVVLTPWRLPTAMAAMKACMGTHGMVGITGGQWASQFLQLHFIGHYSILVGITAVQLHLRADDGHWASQFLQLHFIGHCSILVGITAVQLHL